MDLTEGVFSYRHRKELSACWKNGDENENVCPVYDFAGHGFALLMRVIRVKDLLDMLNSIHRDLDIIIQSIHMKKNEDNTEINHIIKSAIDKIDVFMDATEIGFNETASKMYYDEKGAKEITSIRMDLEDLSKYLKLAKYLRINELDAIQSRGMSETDSKSKLDLITDSAMKVGEAHASLNKRMRNLLDSSKKS